MLLQRLSHRPCCICVSVCRHSRHHGGKREQVGRLLDSRSRTELRSVVPQRLARVVSCSRTEVSRDFFITRRLSPKSDRHSTKLNFAQNTRVIVYIIPIAPILATEFCCLSAYRSTRQAVFARIFFDEQQARKKISSD